MQYVNSIISYKPEDSGNLRSNYRALCIQGWAFKDLLCFQRVAFRNNHSDNIQIIIDSYIQRLIEDYRKLYSENTFGELQRITFTEKHSNNNIQKNIQNNIDRFNFHIFLTQEKNQQCSYKEIFQNFEGEENFIKEIIEEICDQKKISVEKALYFYIFLVFLLLQHAIDLPLERKIVTCYVKRKFGKLNPFQN